MGFVCWGRTWQDHFSVTPVSDFQSLRFLKRMGVWDVFLFSQINTSAYCTITLSVQVFHEIPLQACSVKLINTTNSHNTSKKFLSIKLQFKRKKDACTTHRSHWRQACSGQAAPLSRWTPARAFLDDYKEPLGGDPCCQSFHQRHTREGDAE